MALYDDGDLSTSQNRKIAVTCHGSQGQAPGLPLRESGAEGPGACARSARRSTRAATHLG
ncbi:hypothetical protein [Streptomyces platensis]